MISKLFMADALLCFAKRQERAVILDSGQPAGGTDQVFCDKKGW